MDGQVFEMITNFLNGKQFPDNIEIKKKGYTKLWIIMTWEGKNDDLVIQIDYTNNSNCVRWIGDVQNIPNRTPGTHILWDQYIYDNTLLGKYAAAVVNWNEMANTKYEPKNEFNMFAEEYLEYSAAESSQDKVEKLDAVADMIFVFIGTLHKKQALQSVLDSVEGDYDYFVEYLSAPMDIKNMGINKPFNTKMSANLLGSLMQEMFELCDNNSAFVKEILWEVLRSNTTKLEDVGDGETLKIGKGKFFSEPDLKSIIDRYYLVK